MSEIEKMYENAGVELIADVKFPTTNVNYNVSYPPFTEEKQIELIKWLGELEEHLEVGIEYQKWNELWCISLRDTYWDYLKNWVHHQHFDQALAGLILDIWQSLSEEEKQQVKGILG